MLQHVSCCSTLSYTNSTEVASRHISYTPIMLDCITFTFEEVQKVWNDVSDKLSRKSGTRDGGRGPKTKWHPDSSPTPYPTL